MSTPYVGEIRLFAGNFAPQGWMQCQGQLMAIAENETLFNLIGTTYGGDGQTTFALPDLQGRVPVHQGQGLGLSPRVVGEKGGTETVTLQLNQLPAHTHALHASTAAASITTPASALLGATTVASYDSNPATTAMAAGAVSSAGGNAPHNNMAPSMAITYIVSLFGIFPSQS